MCDICPTHHRPVSIFFGKSTKQSKSRYSFDIMIISGHKYLTSLNQAELDLIIAFDLCDTSIPIIKCFMFSTDFFFYLELKLLILTYIKIVRSTPLVSV